MGRKSGNKRTIKETRFFMHKKLKVQQENENDDNLKAYICHELSSTSPQHNDNMISKKRSATERLLDWIQYDNYPQMTLEQANKVLVNGDKISVRGNDLITLKKQSWLNDEVINFYVELILKRAAIEPGKYPKIHMFNTFFLSIVGNRRISRCSKNYQES